MSDEGKLSYKSGHELKLRKLLGSFEVGLEMLLRSMLLVAYVLAQAFWTVTQRLEPQTPRNKHVRVIHQIDHQNMKRVVCNIKFQLNTNRLTLETICKC